MVLSNILSNLCYCGAACLLIYAISFNTNVLVYRKGAPLFVLIILLILKMLIPIEFHFSRPIVAKGWLTSLKRLMKMPLSDPVSVEILLCIIWILGSCLLLIHITYRSIKIHRALSLVPQVSSRIINECLEEICKQKGIRFLPKVICLEQQGPFIFGIKKPIIVLPDSSFLDRSTICFVLSHELEHYKRHHLQIKLLIELIAIIYWWNPFIWLLKRSAINLLEVQADAGITEQSSTDTHLQYAQCLIDIARRTTNHKQITTALSFSISRLTIKQRLKAVLTSGNEVNTLLARCMIGVVAALLICSTLFIFEPYLPNEETLGGAFSIEKKTDYWVMTPDGYDLYVDGVYMGTNESIPNSKDFPRLEIYDKPLH